MSLSELLSESCNYYMCFKKNGNFHPSICYSYTCCFSFLQIAIKCQNSYVFHLIEMPPRSVFQLQVSKYLIWLFSISAVQQPQIKPRHCNPEPRPPERLQRLVSVTKNMQLEMGQNPSSDRNSYVEWAKQISARRGISAQKSLPQN